MSISENYPKVGGELGKAPSSDNDIKVSQPIMITRNPWACSGLSKQVVHDHVRVVP